MLELHFGMSNSEWVISMTISILTSPDLTSEPASVVVAEAVTENVVVEAETELVAIVGASNG
jgi:hypothetical protein